MLGGSGTSGTGFSFGTPASTQATTSGGLFGTPATGSGSSGFTFGSSTPASTTASVGLTFGTPASGTAQGLSFGTAPASTGQTGGFSLGGSLATSAAPASSGGFSFGAPATTAAPASTGGFSFGASAASTAASTQATTGGFNFGQSTGFSVGTPASTTTGGLGLGPTPASTGTVGFSLSGSSTATTTSNALLSGLLGAPKTTTTSAGLGSGFSLGSTPQTTSAGTGFKLGTTPATTTTVSSGFSFTGGLKTGQTATTQSSATTTAAGLPGLGFGTQPTTTTAATGFSLATATTSSSGLGLKLPTSTAAPAATQPSTQMNYRQLEEQINKWMTELEEQERLFLQQATQVNAWDRLLIDNGEKITQLNGDMERVKVDQNKLEQELEFIKSQQRELQELLVPMEKALEQIPSSSLQPHADLERENTYQLADNIDAQLKRMVQDLKEIIDHLNTSTSNQDTNDPIQQITKILNAHMDSLQWIDSNTALLSRKVEEISKQMESQRKDQERNFRLVYD